MSDVFTMENVTVTYGRGTRKNNAIDNINLDFPVGKSIGIVGESGSGKSTLARCLVGLLIPDSGIISYKGQDISNFDKQELRNFRREVQMVFQDPYSSLNPRMRIKDIVSEGIKVFGLENNTNAINKRTELILSQVGITDEQLDRHPRQFSGGQRQRISIARALAVSPQVLICDEPVSSLDVSIQAQILNLLRELTRTMNLQLVFISHDLGVIRYISDYIIVMRHGKVVEAGDLEQIYNHPREEYTKSLLDAVPLPDPKIQRTKLSI